MCLIHCSRDELLTVTDCSQLHVQQMKMLRDLIIGASLLARLSCLQCFALLPIDKMLPVTRQGSPRFFQRGLVVWCCVLLFFHFTLAWLGQSCVSLVNAVILVRVRRSRHRPKKAEIHIFVRTCKRYVPSHIFASIIDQHLGIAEPNKPTSQRFNKLQARVTMTSCGAVMLSRNAVMHNRSLECDTTARRRRVAAALAAV